MAQKMSETSSWTREEQFYIYVRSPIILYREEISTKDVGKLS